METAPVPVQSPVQAASVRDQLLLHTTLAQEVLFHLPCLQAHQSPSAPIMASSEADFRWGPQYCDMMVDHPAVLLRVKLAGVFMSIL